MNRLRCGLCNVNICGSWEDHVKSEEHQSKLPKISKNIPQEFPVQKISSEEKRKNKMEQLPAKIKMNLGYVSVANGLSFYKVICECGEVNDVYCWRGTKRCANCWKVIYIPYSLILGDSDQKESGGT